MYYDNYYHVTGNYLIINRNIFNVRRLCRLPVSAPMWVSGINNFQSRPSLELIFHKVKGHIQHLKPFQMNVYSQTLNDITQRTIGILKHAEAKEPPNRRHRGRPDNPAPDTVFFLETDKVLSYFLNMIMLCKLTVFQSLHKFIYINN